MKNKFKKSRIIVPTLALITATTVASVTGTVAWFTASQTAKVTAANFTTASADGKLEVTATAGIATSKTTGSTDGITINATGMLDASYDGAKVYTDVPNAGSNDNKYQEIASDYKLGDTNKYYAVTWTYQFSVTVDSGVNSTYAIFLDGSNTSFADVATKKGTTMPGLRISINGSKRLVVGASTASKNNQYVSGVNATSNYTAPVATDADSNNTYFFSSEYVSGGANVLANATGYVTDPSSRGDYIGTTDVPNSDHKALLSATVVAWFEGTDPSIVSGENNTLPDMSSVKATLGFYAREIKTA